MNKKEERRIFSEKFKQQIFQLYNASKPRTEICWEYNLVPTVVNRWIQRINENSSAEEFDNRPPEKLELL